MINNGLTQPTTNGQPVQFMQQPQVPPQVPMMAGAPAPQMQQQFPVQQPQPQQGYGGGYSGPPMPTTGFNGTAPQPQFVPYQQPAQPQFQQPWAPPQMQQPAPMPAQQPQQQPITQQQNDAILAAVRQYGYDPSRFQSGDELLRTIAESARNLERLPQLEALAQVGARSLSQQQPQTQQPVQPQGAPQQGEGPAWQPPPYDPTWERFLDLDERTGMYVAADPALVHYADQANRFRQWQQAQARQFWQNPYEFMHQGLAPRLQKEFVSPLEQRLAQIERAMEQQQLMDAIYPYEGHLFGRDQTGQPNYNQLTPMGNAFNNAYRHSAEFRNAQGQTLSVEERVRYALSQAQFQQPAQLPAPQQPAGYLPAPQQPHAQYVPMQQPGVTYQPTQPVAQPQHGQPQQPAMPQHQQQDDFLARALGSAMQQAQAQPNGYTPAMVAGLVASAERGFSQNPTASFEAQAIAKARELGITL